MHLDQLVVLVMVRSDPACVDSYSKIRKFPVFATSNDKFPPMLLFVDGNQEEDGYQGKKYMMWRVIS